MSLSTCTNVDIAAASQTCYLLKTADNLVLDYFCTVGMTINPSNPIY